MAEEPIHETIKRIMARIAPDPHKPMFVLLCKVLDKLSIVDVTYDPVDDTYDISYEDGRQELKSLFITRKEIKDANL